MPERDHPTTGEETADDATRADEDAARTRVRGALLGRPSRGQAVVAVLLAVLGFAAATQVSAIRSDDDFTGARRDELVQLLQTLAAAQDRVELQLAELEDTRDSLQLSTDQRQTALDEARRELDALRLLSGQVGATGPGVVITIQDPDGNVGDVSLLNVVEELRDAGAEAIEINNTVRVVAQTWFRTGPDPAEPSLVVDGQTLKPPYVLEAIGASDVLATVVGFPGGLRDEVEALGGTVTVTEIETLQIQSLAVERELDFAAPNA